MHAHQTYTLQNRLSGQRTAAVTSPVPIPASMITLSLGFALHIPQVAQTNAPSVSSPESHTTLSPNPRPSPCQTLPPPCGRRTRGPASTASTATTAMTTTTTTQPASLHKPTPQNRPLRLYLFRSRFHTNTLPAASGSSPAAASSLAPSFRLRPLACATVFSYARC